jgi:hypothetical protein
MPVFQIGNPAYIVLMATAAASPEDLLIVVGIERKE